VRALLFASLLSAACGSPVKAPPDPTALDVTPGAYHLDSQTLADLADGDVVDLIRPPQGGFVIFVGARVRNLHDPTVELRGRLLNPSSGALVTEEGRVVDLNPTPGDPTVWLPDLRSYTNVSNVPVCPASTNQDSYGVPFSLEVRVTEKISGRAGVGRRKVTLACRQSDAAQLQLCQCECAAGFVLGKCGTMP
jgi:hypothetical protein